MARTLAGVGVTTFSLACGPPDAAPTAEVDATGADLAPVVHAHLDSAATAYRDGDLTGARSHYHTAADSAPDLAAAWLGLFLTERALGNISAADSALRRARTLATGDSVTGRPGP